MAILREHDFDNAAGRAVDRFLSGGSKLADAVAEEAVGGGMNPDQIERLVQAANTMAFLRLMESRKAQGAGDLLHEFDPTDARHIIQMIVNADDAPHPGPEATPGMPGPPDMAGVAPGGGSDELPDEMSAIRSAPKGPPAGLSGGAGEDDAEKTPKAFKAKDKDDDKDDDKNKEKSKAKEEKEAALLAGRRRKLAAVLEDQYRQAELAFEERYAALRTQFRRAHVPATFVNFEKDALAEHGSEVGIGIVNAMREERGMPPLVHEAALTKIADLQDRHLVEDTEELRLFGSLVKIATDAEQLRRGVEWMRAQCS